MTFLIYIFGCVLAVIVQGIFIYKKGTIRPGDIILFFPLAIFSYLSVIGWLIYYTYLLVEEPRDHNKPLMKWRDD